ncbi:hypothetical protein BH24CHL6_BH24CHL6_01970 [soil metagenome]
MNADWVTYRHPVGLSLSHPPGWRVQHAQDGLQIVEGQLRAIVGLELVIGRIEAKFKLSQNRSAEDVAGVVEGLLADGETPMADAVDEARRG